MFNNNFAETIAEEFHSEVNIKWSLRSLTHALALFEAKSVVVEVDFEQREPNGAWHVGFRVASGELSDRTNMAFHIFNGVFQAVRECSAVREPDRLVFIAKDKDLAGIYRTYLRREHSEIEQLGYRLEGPHRMEPYTEWTLRRARASEWRD